MKFRVRENKYRNLKISSLIKNYINRTDKKSSKRVGRYY